MSAITSNIPKSKTADNIGTISTNTPKSKTVYLAEGFSDGFGATVVSNRTEKRGAMDNIKTKHQQNFGFGQTFTRRSNPKVVR